MNNGVNIKPSKGNQKNSRLKRALKWLGVLPIVLILILGSLKLLAPYNDGPIEFFAGGPFRSGQLAETPADWSFISDDKTIQFQTLVPAVSRTIWFAVVDGRLFFTSNMQGRNARLKKWPYDVADDNRVILRAHDKLYEQRLRRITSGPDIQPVLEGFDRKYNDGMHLGTAEVTDGITWMYEIVDG